MANLAEVSQEGCAGIRYYRSQSLISPDRRYAVYSRIQLQAQPDFTRSRASSVLYLKHLKTGDLQIITTSSSLIEQFDRGTDSDYQLGTIAILIPVAWSEQGNRILAREFEGIFGSSMASDCAIVWDQSTNQVKTFAPNYITYTTAVLLGWSQSHPDRVLFRVGNLGEDQWQLWTVDSQGQTTAAPDDRPIIFGQSIISNWTGPQVAA